MNVIGYRRRTVCRIQARLVLNQTNYRGGNASENSRAGSVQYLETLASRVCCHPRVRKGRELVGMWAVLYIDSKIGYLVAAPPSLRPDSALRQPAASGSAEFLSDTQETAVYRRRLQLGSCQRKWNLSV